jgi:hypothetical protein
VDEERRILFVEFVACEDVLGEVSKVCELLSSWFRWSIYRGLLVSEVCHEVNGISIKNPRL